MIALRLTDPCPWPGGYSSSAVSGWMPGEVREVTEAEAEYLLGAFGPGVFEVVEEPAPTPARRKK